MKKKHQYKKKENNRRDYKRLEIGFEENNTEKNIVIDIILF